MDSIIRQKSLMYIFRKKWHLVHKPENLKKLNSKSKGLSEERKNILKVVHNSKDLF